MRNINDKNVAVGDSITPISLRRKNMSFKLCVRRRSISDIVNDIHKASTKMFKWALGKGEINQKSEFTL